MIKKLLCGLAAIFTFVTSTSATTSSSGFQQNEATSVSLTYVEGTGTTGTPGQSGQDVTKLVDGKSDTKWCSSTSDGHFNAIFSAPKQYCITKYVLITGGDTASWSGRNWKNWKIYGGNSVDGPWTNLVSHSGCDLPAASTQSVTYTDIVNTGFFKYFYIDLYANSGVMQQMSEMTLYGASSDVELNNMSLTYANKGNIGTTSGSQSPDKLVDGKINNNDDKWCSYVNSPYTFSAVYSADEEFTLCAYVLRTGGDSATYSSRNWKNWKIYGGDSTDGPWTTLVEHNNDSTLTGSSTPFAFTDVAYKDKAFKHFKVEFTVSATGTQYCQQMELMEFYGIYQYGISYMDGDTSLSLTPKTYLKGTGLATLPNAPEKTGLSFEGWYDAKMGGNKITGISPMDTGNKVLYARYVDEPTSNALGGYYMKNGNKQQIVMFAVTYADYANLSDGDTCGIYIYSDAGSTLTKTFSTTNISAVKAKEGRFYCVYGENETITENATYYAKGYIISGGTTIYTSLMNAAGNYDTEYKI